MRYDLEPVTRGSRSPARALADQSGLSVIEVVIAIALFAIVVVPVSILLAESGNVTALQRDQAIATNLANQTIESSGSQPGAAVATVSGIRFTITTQTTSGSSTPICETVGTTSVPLAQQTVTVSWANGNHRVQVTRWQGSYTGTGSCS